jgi:hypothetical protein
MRQNKMIHNLPIGVCVLPQKGINVARTVSCPDYIFEILEHAGLFHERVAYEQLQAALAELQILVTIGDVDFDQTLRDELTRWVEKGGAWLSIAGTCGMDSLLGGVRQQPEITSWGGGARSLGEGYLVTLDASHPALSHVNRPLHLFGGATVVASGAKVLAHVHGKHGQPTDRPGMLERAVGAGRTILITPDLTGTIVRIQQGIGVTRDGVPAADGTGGLDDYVLKADDGAVLDWDFDRDVVPGTGGKFRAMLDPIADVWREILLRSIFYLAQQTGVSLAILWLYPRKLPALAHISHDSDGNEPEKAEDLLRLLDETRIKTTWCVLLPGYDAALTAKIKSAGHELAIHYDALGEGTAWSEQDWRRQVAELNAQFGQSAVSNKNHGTRWEGDTEFFEWCVNAGIELDQTKSPSKTGECGFTFGTCHPYFPITYRGRMIDCLELCTHVWDMPAWAPTEVFEPLLASVQRHHGILHQLFHPFHTVKPEVAQAFRLCVRRAREEGMEWWTARQINDWERARRGVRLERCTRDDSGWSLTVRSDKSLPDATLLTLRTDRPASQSELIAWGFAFDAVVQTLEPGRDTVIRVGSGYFSGRSEK